MAHYQHGFKLEENAKRDPILPDLVIVYIGIVTSIRKRITKFVTTESKVVQYADNTDLTLRDDRLSFEVSKSH